MPPPRIILTIIIAWIAGLAAPNECPKYLGGTRTARMAVSVNPLSLFAFVSYGDGLLELYQISDPTRPAMVWSFTLLPPCPGTFVVTDTSVAERYLYAAFQCVETGQPTITTGVFIFDINTVQNPVQLPTFTTVVPPNDGYSALFAAGTVLYVGAGQAGIKVLDVSVPAAATQIGALDTAGFVKDLAWRMGLVFALDVDAGNQSGDGLVLIDVKRPSSPREVASLGGMKQPMAIIADEKLVYITDQDEDDPGVWVIDCTTASAPAVAAFIPTEAATRGIALQKDWVYVGLQSGEVPSSGVLVMERTGERRWTPRGRYPIVGDTGPVNGFMGMLSVATDRGLKLFSVAECPVQRHLRPLTRP